MMRADLRITHRTAALLFDQDGHLRLVVQGIALRTVVVQHLSAKHLTALWIRQADRQSGPPG